MLYQFKEAGVRAYLVGGCVRDLLLGREPKDFDVATEMHPDEVKALFRNSRLIGRRFRLVHLRYGREVIEVATFRAQHEGDAEGGVIEGGMILRDNVYGTLEDDAWRRDFTVNALYYTVEDFSIVDYTDGVADLKAGILRLIGEPEVRYREDPVRMLRAVRFAAKLGFRIHSDSEKPLFELGHLLRDIPPARLFEEILKLFMGGMAVQTFELLRHYGLFEHLFPQTDRCLDIVDGELYRKLLLQALRNTDERIAIGKPVTPAFLHAALLWGPLSEGMKAGLQAGQSEIPLMQQVGRDVLSEQIQSVALPKRFSLQAREIWGLQPRLRRTAGKRAMRLLDHPRFRAAYDFMLLRAGAGEGDDVQTLCDWWTKFQEVEGNDREGMSKNATHHANKRPRRKRTRKTKKTVASDTNTNTGDTTSGSAKPVCD